MCKTNSKKPTVNHTEIDIYRFPKYIVIQWGRIEEESISPLYTAIPFWGIWVHIKGIRKDV